MTRNSHSIKHEAIDAPPGAEAASAEGTPSITDATRFAELVSQNIDFVWRTVRRLGVSAADADDATQQVFVVAHQKVAEIRTGSERAFLVAVSTRVASRMRRTNRRREQTQQHFSEIPVTNVAFSEHAVSRVEARDLVGSSAGRNASRREVGLRIVRVGRPFG